MDNFKWRRCFNTCFFIDTGIDTGEKIVLTKSFSYNALKEQSSSQDLHQAKEFLFQQDVQIYKKSLKNRTIYGIWF